MNKYELEETILKLENVSLTLGDDKVQILRDINLEVKNVTRKTTGLDQGQIVSLLAPSGVGKTQLLKIIAGLNTPDTGSVLIGHPLEPTRLGKVGVVQQNYPLFESRTVLGNLEVAVRKIPKKEGKEKIDLYLNHFGLLDKKSLYPAQLSGGQRQRVAIAQQLLCSEHFLLLDEPFSGLDINMIEKVSEMIVHIANLDELNTVIIVSHDISATCAISDTVWLLGKERNEQGEWKAGATIRHQYDLMGEGLAWRKDIRDLPQFTDFVKEIRHEFKTLA